MIFHLIKEIKLVLGFIGLYFFAIFIQLYSNYPIAKFFSYQVMINYQETGLCRFDSSLFESGVNGYQNNEHKLLLIYSVSPLIFLILAVIGYISIKKSIVIGRSTYQKLVFKQWLCIFFTFLSLRAGLILIFYIISIIFFTESSFLINEINIASILNINPLLLLVPFTAIGFFLVKKVMSEYIPSYLIKSFLIASIVGGLFSYFIWFKILGPLILPI